MTGEQQKEYNKAYYQAHKDAYKAKMKAWYESNKEQRREYQKAYNQAHKEHVNEYKKEYTKEYNKADVNTLGQTKNNIRVKSNYYLSKYGTKIEGYEIHHCCTYDDPSKFIYCSKEIHLKIHKYLRDNNIDADSNHYEYIKHLLDDSVVKFGI